MVWFVAGFLVSKFMLLLWLLRFRLHNDKYILFLVFIFVRFRALVESLKGGKNFEISERKVQFFKRLELTENHDLFKLWITYWTLELNSLKWKKSLIDTGDSEITKGYFVRARYWAICLEIAISRPVASQISPSSSKSPHVINRVRKMHFNHWVVGMLRILTENSIVGTHATIPWLVKTAGGNESATSRIENISKGRSFLNSFKNNNS